MSSGNGNGNKSGGGGGRDDERGNPAIPMLPQIEQRRSANYRSYRSLLITGRAVRKQGTRVIFSTAGDRPQESSLVCQSGARAREIAMALGTELRKARSDDEYNAMLIKFLKEVRSAWPEHQKVTPVHECDRGNSGEACTPNGLGITPCGFDWTRHELSGEDCICNPRVDEDSDILNGRKFIVHRDYKKKEIYTQ